MAQYNITQLYASDGPAEIFANLNSFSQGILFGGLLMITWGILMVITIGYERKYSFTSVSLVTLVLATTLTVAGITSITQVYVYAGLTFAGLIWIALDR